MRRLAPLVLLACLLGSLVAGCAGKPTADGPHRLPDATLGPLRETDRSVALRDLRGPMVVNVWANWCIPCRKELPIVQRFHAEHPDVRVLGVDWQDPNKKAALALARQVGLTYPLVVDREPVIQTQAMPTLILVDDRGHVVYRASVAIKSLGQLEGLVRTHLGVDL